MLTASEEALITGIYSDLLMGTCSLGVLQQLTEEPQNSITHVETFEGKRRQSCSTLVYPLNST